MSCEEIDFICGGNRNSDYCDVVNNIVTTLSKFFPAAKKPGCLLFLYEYMHLKQAYATRPTPSEAKHLNCPASSGILLLTSSWMLPILAEFLA